MPFLSEVVYVNDGSKDGTLGILRSLSEEHDNVSVVDPSRNFGKEIALTAVMDHPSGDAVVVIDADLQDPPELIPDLVRIFDESGADVIYAQRVIRHALHEGAICVDRLPSGHVSLRARPALCWGQQVQLLAVMEFFRWKD
jgi:glycosyltransferase involved in cell wall biosynthesis